MALIPGRLRRHWPGPRRRFIAFTPGGEIEILGQQNDGRPVPAPQTAGDTGDDEYLLLLRPGQFLHRRLVLPLAARQNLTRIVRLEIDRHTPFEADQVYFDARITGQSGSRIDVELIAVPRRQLDRQLAAAGTAGIPVGGIAILDRGKPRTDLDLSPPGIATETARRPRRLNLALAALLLVLTAAALLLPIHWQQRRIQALERRVATTRAAAIRADDIRRRLTTLQSQRRFLVERKRHTPVVIRLLEELSRRLPEDTWLTQLHYQDGQLRLDGRSPAASRLVELLESSPDFDNVHFVSPITQDRRSGLERFRISMDVQHGSGQADPSQ